MIELKDYNFYINNKKSSKILSEVGRKRHTHADTKAQASHILQAFQA